MPIAASIAKWGATVSSRVRPRPKHPPHDRLGTAHLEQASSAEETGERGSCSCVHRADSERRRRVRLRIFSPMRHTALSDRPAGVPARLRVECVDARAHPGPARVRRQCSDTLAPAQGRSACGETSAKKRRARAHPDVPSSTRRAPSAAGSWPGPASLSPGGERPETGTHQPGPEGRRRGRGPTGTGRRAAGGMGGGRGPAGRDRVRRCRREDRHPPHRRSTTAPATGPARCVTSTSPRPRVATATSPIQLPRRSERRDLRGSVGGDVPRRGEPPTVRTACGRSVRGGHVRGDNPRTRSASHRSGDYTRPGPSRRGAPRPRSNCSCLEVRALEPRPAGATAYVLPCTAPPRRCRTSCRTGRSAPQCPGAHLDRSAL